MTQVTLPQQIASDSEYQARRTRYERNRAYYAGTQPALRTRKPRGAGRNFEALFTDTIASYMGAVTLAYGETAEATAWETYLRDVLDACGGEQAALDAELACAVDGDGAWKVTWDADEARVRITIADPATLWTRPHPADPYSVDLIAQQYTLAADDAEYLFPTAPPPNTSTVRVTEGWTRDAWEVWYGADLVAHDPNPYAPMTPYVLYPNLRAPGEFWGRGETAALHDIQDELNAEHGDLDSLSSLAAAILVLIGATADNDVALRPGTIIELPEGSQAFVLDLLQNNAIAQQLWHIVDTRQTMFQLAKVPVIAIGQGEKVAALSGVALQVELGPLLRHVARKRLSRTTAQRQRAALIARCASLFGAANPPASRPAVLWEDTLPQDRTVDLANARLEDALGRDRLEILRLIGADDPAAEFAARLAQDAQIAALTPAPKEAPVGPGH